MVSLGNSHTDATSKRWHLWEIYLMIALNSTPGWQRARMRIAYPPQRIDCLNLLLERQKSSGFGESLGGKKTGERDLRKLNVGLNPTVTLHPGVNPGANLKSISHRCHPILAAFVWELTKHTIDFPLG